MSEPQSKRPRNTNDAPYELIYWPGFPGRGEFIRLLFEEAAVPYTDHAQEYGPDGAVERILGLISTDKGADAAGPSNPPVLAPPILRHGELVLHQTPNILLYLAPRLGLAPKLDGSSDDSGAMFHLNQIVLTLNDGFVNELHDTHHPVSVSLYYEDQKREAKLRTKHFLEERVPKFLGYAQRVITSKASGEGPWMYGGEFTYADLFLFHALDGMMYAFPKTLNTLRRTGEYEAVFALHQTVKQRPNIKAYLESERRLAYGNGIYRQYSELESPHLEQDDDDGGDDNDE